MMEYSDDELLPLSGIQHFAFCRRQWALIHIEQQWQDNLLTFGGRQLHQRTDDPFFTQSRGSVLIIRSLPLISRSLGLYGVADVVEFWRDSSGVSLPGHSGSWRVHPVEYKYGRSKPDDRDMVQLCAQAMCLEEMLNVSVTEGDLFYGRTRRRQRVEFDEALRQRVRKLAAQMHELFEQGVTPAPEKSPACRSCSLVELCLPELKSRRSVHGYLAKALRESP